MKISSINVDDIRRHVSNENLSNVKLMTVSIHIIFPCKSCKNCDAVMTHLYRRYHPVYLHSTKHNSSCQFFFLADFHFTDILLPCQINSNNHSHIQSVRAISSQKKALVAYLESFPKHYNKVFFHQVLFELQGLK